MEFLPILIIVLLFISIIGLLLNAITNGEFYGDAKKVFDEFTIKGFFHDPLVLLQNTRTIFKFLLYPIFLIGYMFLYIFIAFVSWYWIALLFYRLPKFIIFKRNN